MCFSAEVNFVASAAIGAVGVATLTHVRHPRHVLFAAMPLFFALHQFTEGFVWLGLDGTIGETARDHAAFLFLLYAQGLLPILMSLSVFLLEDVGWRRMVLAAITLIALVFGAYMIWGVMSYPTSCYVENRSIVYSNPVTETTWTGIAYIFVTCGALVLSSFRVVRWFGVYNLVGLTIIILAKSYAFSSVWCFYAAVISVMLYWQFRNGKILSSSVP
ncbi:hypothetical protein FMN63_27910 [Stappia sp. BW2]|jgi:hypothetical protein|uniref:DUF6629 family protein n=1 Tax=Stappia sp. BW2 TaxID=2592622 RepID=UPI0011DE6B4E|nr:DUF6629 family protein [Stappia sp. BW2]TYC64057.1 hypothetical protein FMN63_27910 [Stappia sp. BW2]